MCIYDHKKYIKRAQQKEIERERVEMSFNCTVIRFILSVHLMCIKAVKELRIETFLWYALECQFWINEGSYITARMQQRKIFFFSYSDAMEYVNHHQILYSIIIFLKYMSCTYFEIKVMRFSIHEPVHYMMMNDI